MQLVNNSILSQIDEFEFNIKSKLNQFTHYIVKLSRDNYGDCIKNCWTVIGVTKDNSTYLIPELENKLPVYSYTYDLDKEIEKILLDNEINL